MNDKNERRKVAAGAVVCQFCVGMLYSWSIFQKPIADMFGWSVPEVSLTFSLSTFMLPVAMIVAGIFLPRLGPKRVAVLGGILLAAGLFIASQTKTLSMLYIGFGILGGFGVGMVYGVPIATCAKWYPDKKGMITGLAVAGFGLGSAVYAPIASRLVARIGPLETFKIQGIAAVVGIIIGASFMKAAPDGYCPEGYSPAAKDASGYGFSPGEMLKTWQYWLLLVMYIFANATGLMTVGIASPAGQSMAGLTPGEAGAVVSFMAIANTLGRFSGGAFSDRFGPFKVIFALYTINAAAMLTLKTASGFAVYAAYIAVLAYSFGGMVGAYPSIVLDYFGEKFYGVNYGIVFMAFGIGGLIGPQIAAKAFGAAGAYYGAFMVAGVLSIAGAVLTFLLKKPVRGKSAVS